MSRVITVKECLIWRHTVYKITTYKAEQHILAPFKTFFFLFTLKGTSAYKKFGYDKNDVGDSQATKNKNAHTVTNKIVNQKLET